MLEWRKASCFNLPGIGKSMAALSSVDEMRRNEMQKLNVDDLDEKFEKWNPMQDDFLDSRFNLYDTGPGAALETALQPAELAKRQENDIPILQGNSRDTIKPYLVFKNLSRGMSANAIKYLCERYGSVKAVDNYPRQSVTVTFDSIADMESVHRALNENEYGFKVIIGKPSLHQRNNAFLERFQENNLGIIDSSPSSSDINMDKRTIRLSGKKPPRLKLTATNVREINEEEIDIAKSDPFCYIFKNDDAHGLERAGLNVRKVMTKKDDEYEYRTGRAFIEMPLKTRQYLEETHKKSQGRFDAKTERYSNKNSLSKENKHTIYKCIVCKEPADISCYRCHPKLYIYCGKQCQNEDWEEHRKICGRNIDPENKITPPRNAGFVSKKNSNKSPTTTESHEYGKKKEIIQSIEKSPSTFSSSSSQNDSFTSKSFPKPDMPAPNSTVTMTAVHKTNFVFIRSKSPDDNTKYFETISKIQSLVKKLKPLRSLPTVGKAVIAKFQNSHEYGRALVLSVTDAKNIKINFLDYGNIETQELSNLYNYPKEFVELSRFALPVFLKDIPNYYMTNTVRSFMYSYLRDIDLVIKYNEEEDLIPITNIYQVDLYDAATNQHLNKTIATLCKPNEPKSMNDFLTIKDLEVVTLPVGKDIKFFVMDNSQLNSGCISCTTKEYALEIERFAEDIQLYGNSLKEQSYAPCVDELCIAKYSLDGLWYRGRCLEKVGDGKPTIHFIDYGNLSYVSVSDIRPYPVKFDWPIYTIDCGIDGLPEIIDKPLVEKLEDLIPCCFPIVCDFVEKFEGENFYTIKLNGLIKKLQEEKLLN